MHKSHTTSLMLLKAKTLFVENLGWSVDIKEDSFEKRLMRVCSELGFLELNECIDFLEDHPKNKRVIQVLAKEFGISETYFFRDIEFFKYFEQQILTQILHKKDRRLAVWSVGCSSGEEAYSLAMLLHKKIPDIEKWNLYIVGTDVNVDVLKKADNGLFSEWSFRRMPHMYKERYFKKVGQNYVIDPVIKNMVHFQYHNILTDGHPYPADFKNFDLILVKNVFIYFEPEIAKEVAHKLCSLIEVDGWLATTPVESASGVFDFKTYTCTQNGSVFQKSFAFEPVKLFDTYFTDEYENSFDFEMEPEYEVKQKKVQKEVIHQEAESIEHILYYKDAIKMLEEGKSDIAKEYLRRSLYLDNKFVAAHIALGNILIKEGEYQSAVRNINKAKSILMQMNPQEEVSLTGGMLPKDLLSMFSKLLEKTYE